MLIVAAVGGNALLRRGEPLTPEAQERNAQAAGQALGALARSHRLVITHGNGPQVGLLALESGAAGVSPPFPLDHPPHVIDRVPVFCPLLSNPPCPSVEGRHEP